MRKISKPEDVQVNESSLVPGLNVCICVVIVLRFQVKCFIEMHSMIPNMQHDY